MLNKKLIAVLLVLIMAFVSGCKENNKKTESSNVPTQTDKQIASTSSSSSSTPIETKGTVTPTTKAIESTKIPTAIKGAGPLKDRILKESSSSDQYTIEEVIYTGTEFKNSDIKIRYPKLKSDNIDVSIINKLIKDTIFNYMFNHYEKDYSNTTIDIKYEVTYNQNGLISIYFDGMFFREKNAHPSGFLISLNYDLKNKKQIYLTDLMIVNEKNVQFVLDSVNGTDYHVPKDYLLEHYGFEELFGACKNSQQEIYGVDAYTYFNKDKIFISFSELPYVLCSHLELSINWSQLLE